MNLQDMVNQVTPYKEVCDPEYRRGVHGIIVEFTNGVNIVYEKDGDNIVFAPIEQLNEGTGRITDIGKNVVTGERENLGATSSWGVGNYFKEKRSIYAQHDQEINDLFGELVDQLQLEKKTARDWAHISTSLGIGILTPVLTPVGLLASLFVGPRNGTGPNVALLSIAPPIMFYNGIKELRKPTSQYYTLGEREITTEVNDNSYPALYLRGREGKFSSMSLLFPTGDIGTISPGYQDDRVNYPATAYLLPPNRVMRGYEQKQYTEATLFLKTDPHINGQLNSLLEERAAFPEVQKRFVAGLNRENQEALLKSIGFM